MRKDSGGKRQPERKKDNNSKPISRNKRIGKHPVKSIVAEIRSADFHDHNMLIYRDLPSFRKVYALCTKQALDSNEIAFLTTTYDPPGRILDLLDEVGVPVNDEAKQGNLMVFDSVRTYQIDVLGAVKFARSLAKRIEKEGKAGIFNISDMGSFFLTERLDELVRYEHDLSRRLDIPIKGHCAYHIDDFSNLTEKQQAGLVAAHKRVVCVDVSL